MDSCGERVGFRQGPGPALQGGGESAGTHVEELSGAKWVVGDFPLLGAPRAPQKAVPNHAALGHAGIDVQSYVT